IELAVISEILRKLYGYDTSKGTMLSFIPMAITFYGYVSHWWTDTPGSLQAAIEEMPEGYAAKMEPIIANIPVLVVMIALVVPVSILAMRLAEKILKK
ncbi:MAG: MptD family putative ECF transporter S component, partial [Candidatus Cryptobacteroides sp.]|nr:MptD family putative ECF transporter S component [Candidatus Cryptobacteroides sp.]